LAVDALKNYKEQETKKNKEELKPLTLACVLYKAMFLKEAKALPNAETDKMKKQLLDLYEKTFPKD
jgi:hypothetical protein